MDQETFDMLLRWLDPDRDTAGKKYEIIRLKLIGFFVRRECLVPEELADETIGRVCHKLPQIKDRYVGEPLLYFYGVARHVYQEWLRRKIVIPSPPEASGQSEERFDCLEQCLARLDQYDRDLIVAYFSYEKGHKVAHRKRLAEDLGITMSVLRMRAHRIKKTLHKCMKDCLGKEGDS